MTDPIHDGITLAEEAVRDIARETGCTRAESARMAMCEIESWSRGVVAPELWPATLDAALSHLSSIAAR